MPFLIDGHNLIARLPDLSLDDPDDEAKLVLKLRGFVARSRKKCYVVFDQGLPGGQSTLSTHSVKVIFAAAIHTNADRVIMERIRNTSDPVNWTVVSSDNEVLDAARRHRMQAMHCRDFAIRLETPAREAPELGEAEHVNVSSKEVAEWLKIFDADESNDDSLSVEPPTLTPTRPAPKPSPSKAPPAKASKKTAPKSQNPSNNMPHLDDEAGWLAIFEGRSAAQKPSVKAPPRPASQEPAETEPEAPAPKKKNAADASKRDNARRRTALDQFRAEAPDVQLSDAEVDEWMQIFQGRDKDKRDGV